MIENGCRIILTDIIRHVALQKPFGDMVFQEKDVLRLAELFGHKSVLDIEDLVRNLIGITVAQYGQLDNIFI